MPTAPPDSLPPGFQSPPASDADSSLAGFRQVDCPLRLRVDDAFSSYQEDDSNWDIDGGIQRHKTIGFDVGAGTGAAGGRTDEIHQQENS